MTAYLYLHELAAEVGDEDLDNDTWIDLHRLAREFDGSVPDDGAGPVPDETRQAVVDAFLQADKEFGTLIPDDEFESYAEEFARDIGAINDDLGWPCNRIDWTAAAEDLQQDYTSVEYQGTTYWYR
jgi:hypothetical protein